MTAIRRSVSAENVTFDPTGTIAATNVQDAIAEVASEGGVGGGSGATSLWEFTTDGALSIGDFAITLSRSAAPIVQSRNLLAVIDPFTINCEVRQVAVLSGSTLTCQSALTKAHSSGVTVYLTGDDHLSLALWGADGSNNNNVNDWAPLQRGINETTLNACWLVGGGVAYVVRAPLFGGNGTRLKQIHRIKAHASLYTPAESTNAMYMSAQNLWQPFTASAATDTFTTTAATGTAVSQKIAFNCPSGETLPGGIVAGRVYYVKSTPSSTTFTISATDGGATIDITADGAGIAYSGINGAERVFMDFVYFSCNSVASLNGVSVFMNQPGYTKDLRVDGNKGTGLIIGGQISNHYNLMLAPASGGVGMQVSGSGHNFYGVNCTDSTGNVADGIQMGAGLASSCFDSNFYGLWTENCSVGIHFVGTSLGCSFMGWAPAVTAGCIGVKVDSGVATVNNSYVLSGGRNSATNNAIQDDARGYALKFTEFPQNSQTSWAQLAGDIAPQLAGRNFVLKTANYTALLVDDVINVDATGGAVTITLPASAHIAGKTYTITKTDGTGNAVTIDGNGSETINGATTKVLAAQYDKATIISNGTGWYIA